MKITLDLPEKLVVEMKIRAAKEGRTLSDVATKVVERGLRLTAPSPKIAAKKI